MLYKTTTEQLLKTYHLSQHNYQKKLIDYFKFAYNPFANYYKIDGFEICRMVDVGLEKICIPALSVNQPALQIRL